MSLTENVFKHVLGHFASGIVIVTSSLDDEPVGMTAQSFTAVSLSPPLILLCPAKTSTSWPKVRQTGKFCVNVLGEDQEDVCRTFAISGGDKFANINWTWNPNGVPIIDGCLAYIECTLYDLHDAGDHDIAVGRVEDLRVGDASGPLLFYRGSYGQLKCTPEALPLLEPAQRRPSGDR